MTKKQNNLTITIRMIKDMPYTWHEGLTIVLVLSGQVQIRIWANELVFKSGDFLLVNNGEIYKLKGITADNLVCMVHMDYDLCNLAQPDFDHCIVLCNTVRYERQHYIKYQVVRRKINELLLTFGRSLEIGNTTYQIDLAKSLISYLCHEFDYVACGIHLKRFSEPVVRRQKNLFIHLFKSPNEDHTLTLKEISSYMGISYAYFRKDIRERYGHGFKWLKYTMITEKSAKLLLTTNESATRIGVQCGFSDHKYMVKYYRIFYECTPSEFRENHRQSKENLDSHVDIPVEMLLNALKFFFSP